VREVYEVYHSFRRLVSGEDEGKTIVADSEPDLKKTWIESFKERVDFEDVSLAGHSFGGGTMLHLLQTPPPDTPLLPAVPAKRCIALDPWLEPLPVPTPQKGPGPHIPVLTINSEAFTVWQDHFFRLVDLMRDIKGALITVVGTTHQAFSDFPLLSPGSPSVAMSLMATITDLSASFLSGTLAEDASIKGKTPDEGKYVRAEGKKKKMAGRRGDVVVHLLGEESPSPSPSRAQL